MALANIAALANTALAGMDSGKIGISAVLIIFMVVILLLKAVRKVIKVIFTLICVAAIYFIMHGGLS